ncbi:MAG TPA: ATP-binding protein [Methylomirabilota bacterium]|nr:ATP-binding protein [Methylomirabilota bacterium]
MVQADRRLAGQVRRLAGQRMVFFAGLPGTGKSLLVHQLAHLAGAGGRRVHLVQWDVARPVFEASPAARRYPVVEGVTHVVVRKAAGLWVRHALAEWSARHPEPEHLLIGETPFVGGRFIELARRRNDRAEALLAAPACRFVIVVPSVDVRRFLEAERERRAANPLHPREREDAPPGVLRELWRELVDVARRLDLEAPVDAGDASAAYDPTVYRRVYETILHDRHVEVVALDVILPTAGLSVYDFAAAPLDLVPSEADASSFIAEVERRYADPMALEREIARWWQVPGTALTPARTPPARPRPGTTRGGTPPRSRRSSAGPA